jgi:hypothetical protein
MTDTVYIGPTKRRAMTKARATRIFLSRDGICFICETRINAARDAWFVEHPDPLAQGGSDDDADLWPAHVRCKPEKDAVDAGRKAKRDRLVTKSWRDKPKRGGFRGWRKMNGEIVWRD